MESNKNQTEITKKTWSIPSIEVISYNQIQGGNVVSFYENQFNKARTKNGSLAGGAS